MVKSRFACLLGLLFSFHAFAVIEFCDPQNSINCPHFLEDLEDSLIWTDVSFEHVFVPKGFDTNDLAEAIVFGWLPSTCYQSPQGRAQKVGKTIQISAQAVKAPGRICMPMQVPFVAGIRLGILEQGDFLVQLQSKEGDLHDVSTLHIEAAKEDQIDDFLYANVERVMEGDDGKKLILSGRNPSDCFEFDRMETVFNGKDTYAVLPIMKKVKDDCPRKMVPFHYEIGIEKEKNNKPMLWHIRSLGGKAVNVVWDPQSGFHY